jgi:hypothetical protein
MGAPKIDGGMTAAEMKAKTDEERAYQKQQEEERRAFAAEEEAKRFARDKQERVRLKQEANEAQQLSTLAENAANSEAGTQATAGAGTITESNTAALDFYGSMYSGMSTDTQTNADTYVSPDVAVGSETTPIKTENAMGADTNPTLMK